MNSDFSPNQAGIYVHVPFCRRRCPYCDFAVSIQVEIPHQRYTQALIDELDERRAEIGDRAVRTVYFGGGTPSLLAPKRLAQILDAVATRFEVASDLEVTLESNPNDVDDAALRGWRRAGINRLSIGCQSFQDRHLHTLRRTHRGDEARRAVVRALQVIDRVSVDVMFAGPSQPMEEWAQDLAVVQALVADHGLDHVSGYNLTIEPDTTFWIRRKQGILEVPDDDVAAAMLERLVRAMEAVGLARYEVSNFAAPGARSEHNSSYWQGRPYLGIGVGAHSLEVMDGGRARRRANPRRYETYMERRREAMEVEVLSADDHLAERLFLGARTRLGIDFQALRSRFQNALGSARFVQLESVLDDLVRRQWMEGGGAAPYRPTERGLNFSDSLAQWLYTAATDPVD